MRSFRADKPYIPDLDDETRMLQRGERNVDFSFPWGARVRPAEVNFISRREIKLHIPQVNSQVFPSRRARPRVHLGPCASSAPPILTFQFRELRQQIQARDRQGNLLLVPFGLRRSPPPRRELSSSITSLLIIRGGVSPSPRRSTQHNTHERNGKLFSVIIT